MKRSVVPFVRRILQSILQAACDLIEPEMLWVKSENAKRKIEAIVEAMDENIEN